MSHERMLVSSAESITSRKGEYWIISLIKVRNKRSPKFEFCGTTTVIGGSEVDMSPMLINWNLLARHFSTSKTTSSEKL